MEKGANAVPISVIATDICDNFGDTDRKFFGEHLKNIVNHYKTLHIFLMNQISVQSIILPYDNIISLPCNFVKETKIGVINSQGRIATMSIDKSLRVPVPNRSMADVDTSLLDIMLNNAEAKFFPFFNCSGIDGGYMGEMYGYACSINTLGYFNIDRENRNLIVSPSVPRDYEIIMEYKSDGVSEGLIVVPTEIVNLLTYRCKAIFCLDKKDPRYTTFNNEYQLEYKQIKKLYYGKPIDVYASVMKSYHKSAPK